jgi:taurine dioxygenase
VGVQYNTIWTPPLVHKTLTGKTGIYFAPFQLGKFVELTQEKSDEIKQILCNHILNEKYLYHHDWEDGDVVISDQWNGIHKRWPFNKMDIRVLHRAGMDYTGVTK